MSIKDSSLFVGEESSSLVLSAWHANLIYISGKKCVLFVNDKTLFNFIAPDARRAEIQKLHQLFIKFLFPVLTEEGFSEEECNEIASEYSEAQYAKSTSKPVLGSMNDIAFHYEHLIQTEGGIHSPMVPQVISKLNRMRMSAINYKYPIDELRSFVQTKT